MVIEKLKHSIHFIEPVRVDSLHLNSACRLVSLLMLMVVVELVVALLALIRIDDFPFLTTVNHLTLYYQLVLFIALGLVCNLHRLLRRLPMVACVIAVFSFSSLSALFVAWVLRFWIVDYAAGFIHFVAQSQLITALLTAIFLRHQYLLQQNANQLRAQIGAKLETLQSHIRPHFLFNTLNNLAALIAIDSQKAEEMVVMLAQMLRYAIPAGTVATVREEIDFARNYCQIEQFRLEHRLRIDWDLSELTDESIPIPTMILQPLLENAVCYGPGALAEGGLINIKISSAKNYLRIEIDNDAPSQPPRSTQEHLHISIDNIRSRLILLYDGKAQFICERNEKSDSDRRRWLCRLVLPKEIILDSYWNESKEVDERQVNRIYVG